MSEIRGQKTEGRVLNAAFDKLRRGKVGMRNAEKKKTEGR